MLWLPWRSGSLPSRVSSCYRKMLQHRAALEINRAALGINRDIYIYMSRPPWGTAHKASTYIPLGAGACCSPAQTHFSLLFTCFVNFGHSTEPATFVQRYTVTLGLSMLALVLHPNRDASDIVTPCLGPVPPMAFLPPCTAQLLKFGYVAMATKGGLYLK